MFEVINITEGDKIGKYLSSFLKVAMILSQIPKIMGEGTNA